MAKIFIQAARQPGEGAQAFNIKGSVAHMRDVVSAIETAVPSAQGQITFESTALPFPDGQEDDELRVFLGEIPDTSLIDGVAQTIAHFKGALADGRLPLKDN